MRIRARTVFLFAAALLGVACGRPSTPVLPADVTDFGTLFTENCSGCHGTNGMSGPARPLNDPVLLAVLPKSTLQQIIENGRNGTAMPAFARAQGGDLYPAQVTALVNGIERNWAKPMSFGALTPPPYAADNPVADIRSGARLFAGNCFMCHAPGARVGPVTDPAYLSLASNQGIRSSIITGRRDLGMPDWRFLHMGRPLTDQDIADLVGYLSSLRPASSPLAQVIALSVQNPQQPDSGAKQ